MSPYSFVVWEYVDIGEVSRLYAYRRHDSCTHIHHSSRLDESEGVHDSLYESNGVMSIYGTLSSLTCALRIHICIYMYIIHITHFFPEAKKEGVGAYIYIRIHIRIYMYIIHITHFFITKKCMYM